MAASVVTGESPPGVPERLADLARALSARAAGVWRVEGDRLVQVAFVAGEGLAEEVARAFAEATRSVSRAQGDLGIVRAATLGVVTASRTAELPAETGSGFWLRAFGASRSVAVPLLDARGASTPSSRWPSTSPPSTIRPWPIASGRAPRSGRNPRPGEAPRAAPRSRPRRFRGPTRSARRPVLIK